MYRVIPKTVSAINASLLCSKPLYHPHTPSTSSILGDIRADDINTWRSLLAFLFLLFLVGLEGEVRHACSPSALVYSCFSSGTCRRIARHFFLLLFVDKPSNSPPHPPMSVSLPRQGANTRASRMCATSACHSLCVCVRVRVRVCVCLEREVEERVEGRQWQSELFRQKHFCLYFTSVVLCCLTA